MSAILDKAKAHYRDVMSATPTKIEIPEWEATAYVKPKLSLEKTGEIMDLSNRGKIAEAMVMTLIYRLVDEEGAPLFRPPEKVVLLKQVDPDVLAKVVTQINNALPTEDDVSGN